MRRKIVFTVCSNETLISKGLRRLVGENLDMVEDVRMKP